MKKLKLLTSLGAVSALGGGVTLTATSCSSNKDEYLAVYSWFTDGENLLPTNSSNYIDVYLYMFQDGKPMWGKIKSSHVEYDTNLLYVQQEGSWDRKGILTSDDDGGYSWTNFQIGLKRGQKATAGQKTNITFSVTDVNGNTIKRTVTYTFADHSYHIETDYRSSINYVQGGFNINSSYWGVDHGTERFWIYDFDEAIQIPTPDDFTCKFDDTSFFADLFKEDNYPELKWTNDGGDWYYGEFTFDIKEGTTKTGTYYLPFTLTNGSDITIQATFSLSIVNEDWS